jgi:hypothetical protein
LRGGAAAAAIQIRRQRTNAASLDCFTAFAMTIR